MHGGAETLLGKVQMDDLACVMQDVSRTMKDDGKVQFL